MLDPCEGYSWPPKATGILKFSDAKCLPSAQSPGPIYMLPTLMGCDNHDPRSAYKKAPCITLKSRFHSSDKTFSPGPIYLPNLPSSGPLFSMKGRLNYKPMQDGPGPCHMLNPIKPCNPGFTLGMRLKENKDNCSPGPAAYGLPSMVGCHYLPNRTNAPCYSLAARQKLIDKTGGPGPGTYSIKNDCTYRHCPPKYSLAARIYPPDAGCLGPGPGTYCPEKVRNFNESPHYSFGIKWCDKVNSAMMKPDTDDVDMKCPINC